ncbi:hypothetical protein K438DRAFT_1756059 [Mycena galopus ATCC 62051]|nr:hypothetical protein K438DRAFT_1756059 [Mycena galopus ATCC 62051]
MYMLQAMLRVEPQTSLHFEPFRRELEGPKLWRHIRLHTAHSRLKDVIMAEIMVGIKDMPFNARRRARVKIEFTPPQKINGCTLLLDLSNQRDTQLAHCRAPRGQGNSQLMQVIGSPMVQYVLTLEWNLRVNKFTVVDLSAAFAPSRFKTRSALVSQNRYAASSGGGELGATPAPDLACKTSERLADLGFAAQGRGVDVVLVGFETGLGRGRREESSGTCGVSCVRVDSSVARQASAESGWRRRRRLAVVTGPCTLRHEARVGRGVFAAGPSSKSDRVHRPADSGLQELSVLRTRRESRLWVRREDFDGLGVRVQHIVVSALA